MQFSSSTYRFTSFSLQPYSVDTALVNVKFDLSLQSTLFDTDLYALEGYLNGEKCTVKILTPTVGINDLNGALPLSVFPNPAASTIYIRTKEASHISIISASGETIRETKAMDHALNTIDIQSLTPGIYLIRVTDGISSAMQKLIKL